MYKIMLHYKNINVFHYYNIEYEPYTDIKM